MKKYPFLIVLLANIVFGQSNVRVHYSFYEMYNQSRTVPAFLQITDTDSYFEVNDKIGETQNSTTQDEETGNIEVIKFSPREDNRFVKKNFKDNIALSLENRNGGGSADRIIFIKEELPNIEWKLGDSEKEILSYRCKTAYATFRGRDYEAWYTPDIPIPDGPWKFSGLPGLILQIKDSAGKVNIEAYSIEMNNDANLELSFSDIGSKDQKIYSWEAYCEHIAENLKQTQKYFRSMFPQTGAIKLEVDNNFETMELMLTDKYVLGGE